MPLNNIVNNIHSISIDTRSMRKGDTFIAIRGKRFDGHDFVAEAFRKGAKSAVVSKKPKIPRRLEGRLVRVKDTLRALGDIAKTHRAKFDIPVIAVTGTNGKTTAKDMIAHVLSARHKVLKNETSKNNLIGLSLTLLGLGRRHDVAVLEMGMNRPGEIDRLSEIAKPEIGVVTNVGLAHLEFLGTPENVFKAKTELLKWLPPNGMAVLNADDARLRNVKGLKSRKTYFGIEKKCDFRATKLSYVKNRWSFTVGGKRFRCPLPGKHNIYNALVAIVIARGFGIDLSAVGKRINSFRQASPMRMDLRRYRDVCFLDDCYNSNPLSMECAVRTLAAYRTGGRKIVVSGDMLELGKSSGVMHETLGRQIASSGVNFLITMGKLSRFTETAAKHKGMRGVFHAESHRAAADFLKKIVKPKDVVLVKGSRGMEMEKVIEQFMKD